MCRVKGVGYRVQDVGSARVAADDRERRENEEKLRLGLGFGVWGEGFKVWGLGFGVQCSGFGV